MQRMASAGKQPLRFCGLDAERPLDDWERSELAGRGSTRIVAITKGDRPRQLPPIAGAVLTSSASNLGIDELRARLGSAAVESPTEAGGAVAATAARCHDSLRQATEALGKLNGLSPTTRGDELDAAVGARRDRPFRASGWGDLY